MKSSQYAYLQAPPKEVKPAPEKVEKLAAKTPQPPSKKPGAAQQKSPSKGGKVDIKGKNKSFVKAMDISSVQPDQAETEVSATPEPKVWQIYMIYKYLN